MAVAMELVVVMVLTLPRVTDAGKVIESSAGSGTTGVTGGTVDV
jgi:hypothetical protein